MSKVWYGLFTTWLCLTLLLWLLISLTIDLIFNCIEQLSVGLSMIISSQEVAVKSWPFSIDFRLVFLGGGNSLVNVFIRHKPSPQDDSFVFSVQVLLILKTPCRFTACLTLTNRQNIGEGSKRSCTPSINNSNLN